MNAMKFVDENLRGFDDEILNPQWLKTIDLHGVWTESKFSLLGGGVQDARRYHQTCQGKIDICATSASYTDIFSFNMIIHMIHMWFFTATQIKLFFFKDTSLYTYNPCWLQMQPRKNQSMCTKLFLYFLLSKLTQRNQVSLAGNQQEPIDDIRTSSAEAYPGLGAIK